MSTSIFLGPLLVVLITTTTTTTTAATQECVDRDNRLAPLRNRAADSTCSEGRTVEETSNSVNDDVRYNASWESLDKRPLPDWYDKAKFGIFIHWGVYSVPSYGGEWFWLYWKGDKPFANIEEFMEKNYPPGFAYGDFATQFTAEFYDPDWWADLFNASGAKYVVLTSKHHEGYTLWPSSVSFNWNSQDVGPHRDLVGELAASIRNRTDIHFGLYHSLYEWFNPLYLLDKRNNFSTRYFPETKTLPELLEIVNKYEPEVIWSDGDWEAYDSYWKSQEFLAWLYNDSPVKDTVVVNDRWGINDMCNHGDYFTCSDRFNPGTLQQHKWENAMTIDRLSWGFRREATLQDYLTIEDILNTLVTTVSCGGNLLMNIGPSKDGRIAPIFEERLRQIGEWLSMNGQAIYETVPWSHQNDTINANVWYTAKKLANGSVDVYAIVLNWPMSNIVALGSVAASKKTAITLLGDDRPLTWSPAHDASAGILVGLPTDIPCSQLKSKWAWVLKLESVTSNN